MEETLVPKRPREEAQMEKDLDLEEYSKRHKPYNHILSLLELEEEESTQDLSPLMTTLQHEITCATNNSDVALFMSPTQQNDQNNLTGCVTKVEEGSTSPCFPSPHHALKEDEEERVTRHLLHASDDALGIPKTGDIGSLNFGEDGFKSGDGFSSLCDQELWKFEDEAANYYALLQSELFLWDQ